LAVTAHDRSRKCHLHRSSARRKKNVTETTTPPKWSIFARRRWGSVPAEPIAVIQNCANIGGTPPTRFGASIAIDSNFAGPAGSAAGARRFQSRARTGCVKAHMPQTGSKSKTPRSRGQPKPSRPVGHAKSRSREVSARDEAAGLKSARSSLRRSVQAPRAREFREPAARTSADPRSSASATIYL
jgi:hypothetical protein